MEKNSKMETGLLGMDNNKVSMSTKLAYALGHIFNDLTAAMWFSYTLIYLQKVSLLEPIMAGTLLLLGQIVDAFTTPIFGFLVDRYSNSIVMFFYILSIVIFQIGWAAVQISHLSMIPSLTSSLLGRTELTAIRYSAQVSSAVVVFVVTWIVLPTNGESMVLLDQHDDTLYRGNGSWW